MTGLTVRHVTVRYGSTIAVADASFEVSPGEMVAVVGPSGSGKSSLLAAIAGIVPCEGQIAWDGEDLAALPVHKRGVGMVFQDGQLFPHRSVARNISFGLEMARMDAASQRARVAELLELVGLEGMGERGVDELSGGERQRVALARSLAPSPRMMLLDEPLSSLDAPLRTRLAVEVRDILLARDIAGVVVTHDLDEAHTMASRVLTMDNAHGLHAGPR
jgi:thiamine transport system ATP-binding protein